MCWGGERPERLREAAETGSSGTIAMESSRSRGSLRCSEAAAGTEAITADVWEDVSIHQPVYVRLPVLWSA